jgi:hypothetical protein
MVGTVFTSCWEKIGRADHHIKTFKDELRIWVDSNPYAPIKKVNADGSRHSVIVNVTNKPPVERWSLITGDAIHNLRSALDHTVYAIAAHESNQSIPPQGKKIQFPIISNPAIYPEMSKRYKIDTLSVDVQEAIKSVQPRNRLHVEAPPLLGLLAGFDDADKHRLLNVVMTNISDGKFQMLTKTSSRIEPGHHFGSIKDGAEVFWFTVDPPNPDLQYYNVARIVVSISHEPGPNGRNYTEVTTMLDWLRDEVVFIINKVCSAVR